MRAAQRSVVGSEDHHGLAVPVEFTKYGHDPADRFVNSRHEVVADAGIRQTPLIRIGRECAFSIAVQGLAQELGLAFEVGLRVGRGRRD